MAPIWIFLLHRKRVRNFASVDLLKYVRLIDAGIQRRKTQRLHFLPKFHTAVEHFLRYIRRICMLSDPFISLAKNWRNIKNIRSPNFDKIDLTRNAEVTKITS